MEAGILGHGLLAVLVFATAVLRAVMVLQRTGSGDPLQNWHLNWGDE